MGHVSPNAILADITHHMKYARYLPKRRRREVFRETVDRNMLMHLDRFPHLEQDIMEAFESVYLYKVLPSMRSMQFAGQAMTRNHARMYNCSYTHIDDPAVFKEVMFLLLSGCGVGYSVQYPHVNRLPPIQKPQGAISHIIDDSIEGWADAVGVLTDAYFYGKPQPLFIYDRIRPAGAPIATSGGVAPGPDCLKTALEQVAALLRAQSVGKKLRPIVCHDLLCHLAAAVLAGGVRRSSYIAHFSPTDKEMLTCKAGDWWDTQPQRALANNSAVFLRNQLTLPDFYEYWGLLRDSGAGEPTIFQTNDRDVGCNPCGEISLRSCGFCNLVEINAATIKDQADFEHRARMAARIATLQATFTGFHFLRPVWQKRAEEEALIGVGMTGIAAGNILNLNIRQAAYSVIGENRAMAAKLGLNAALRTTTVKPSGTSSLELSKSRLVSSGVHGYHDRFYLRRMIVAHTEPIYRYLKEHHPYMLEESVYRPETESVITLPLAAPEGAITRDEGPGALLSRVLRLQQDWVKVGHRHGVNTNNVSCTIPLKDDEWDEVALWWWKHRDQFVSITFIPHNGGNYKQTPFETITEREFQRRVDELKPVDLKQVKEGSDNTKRRQAVACAGGQCEWTPLN